MAIEFVVSVEPIPQPRVKARRIGARGIQIYTPQNASIRAYKAAIAQSAMEAAPQIKEPAEGPLEVFLEFFMERPSTRMGEGEFHAIRPDIDNLVKAVLDSLNGLFWKDDGQIVDLIVRKRWAKTFLGGVSGRKKLSSPGYIFIRIARPEGIEQLDESFDNSLIPLI